MKTSKYLLESIIVSSETLLKNESIKGKDLLILMEIHESISMLYNKNIRMTKMFTEIKEEFPDLKTREEYFAEKTMRALSGEVIEDIIHPDAFEIMRDYILNNLNMNKIDLIKKVRDIEYSISGYSLGLRIVKSFVDFYLLKGTISI